MGKYSVVFGQKIRGDLSSHAAFIARVSLPAARKFYNEFAATIKRLSENPYMFPICDDSVLPEGVYRRALFGKWYKIYYYIEDTTVYIDAVVDGRRNS